MSARWRGATLIALVAAGCGYGGGGAYGSDAAADSLAGASPRVGAPVPTLERQASGTTALLQAVSAVDENVVWASGHRGTWARTLNGGSTWTTGTVEGADSLQFRDVHGHSADRAWLLSAGPGELSRIYRTDDGGASWTLQWINREPDGFYDCLDFWDGSRGAVYGDAVAGELRILRTLDGGEQWSRLAGDALPRAHPGEGGFAASGTCLVTGPAGRAWVATGNAAIARVLRTGDWAATWTAVDAPIPGKEGAGLFSVSFRDSLNGVVFGGDLGEPSDSSLVPPRVAVSDDGGASWKTGGQPPFAGAIFGGAWVPGSEPPIMVAVAPTGSAYSVDGGMRWMPLDSAAYWGVGFAPRGAGWLVGPGGRITRVGFR